MSIDDTMNKLKEDYLVYEFKDFRLADKKKYYTLYFREKPDNPYQLSLFSKDYLRSLEVYK